MVVGQCFPSRFVSLFIATSCLLTICDGFLSTQNILPPTNACHKDWQRQEDQQSRCGSSQVLFSSSVPRNAKSAPSSNTGGKKKKNSRNKSKGKNNKNKGKKAAKWDRRRGNKNDLEAFVPRPRPVLAQYAENRNWDVNERRLRSIVGNIACQTSDCGCVTEHTVSDIDIVRSAARFFSSTAIRRNRLDVEKSGDDWVVEEEDDGFYELVVPSETSGWRTQSKLVTAPKSSGQWAKDGCVFGIYQRGTHKVAEIPNCKVHHPSINRAAEALEKATEKVGTPAYTDDGGLRYVQFQVERTTGKIALTLVWGCSDIKWTQPALSRLTKALLKSEPDLWHSLWCHCNDGPGNNIFSRNPSNWHRLTGHEFVREPFPVGNLGWLYFSPLAFRQGNLDGFDIIANDVARAVPGGSKVCELYAGVGMLGLTSLLFHHYNHEKYRDQIDGYGEPLTWVRCSDENPANPRCFSASLRSLPRAITHHKKTTPSEPTTLGDLMKAMEAGDDFESQGAVRSGPKASYMVASAAKALKSGQALGADVLIVDPPRKGLEDEVLEELCKPYNPNQPCVESPDMLTVPEYLVNWTNDVQKLIYVSCGFDALARDCDKLLSSGGGW
eukprot:CAMPEP_0197189912 /NCGR_PEP_ID=MMETSP1423-20130617/20637_1 /TAXON_ID=476441 /ORGANISM="Pseudo-nitzschia heimii, Strain UNC1101" /LENGTH=609 /DNA_ID=CAMNT_0042642169 /DNA_START=36 /DNA_END=1862 /DNA_ORIENTATION=+